MRWCNLLWCHIHKQTLLLSCYAHLCSKSALLPAACSRWSSPQHDLVPLNQPLHLPNDPVPLFKGCPGTGISLTLPAAVEAASSAFLQGAARRLASVGSGSSMLAQRIAGTHFLGEVEAEDDYGEALGFRV